MLRPYQRWAPFFESLGQPHVSVDIYPGPVQLRLRRGNVASATGMALGTCDSLAEHVTTVLRTGGDYNEAAFEASRCMVLVLRRALSDPNAHATRQAPLQTREAPLGLPLDLRSLFAEALALARPASLVALEYSPFMQRSVRAIHTRDERALGALAYRTLTLAQAGCTLGELCQRSGRGEEDRTERFWLAFDLLAHRGLLELETLRRSTREPVDPAPTEPLDDLIDEDDPFGLHSKHQTQATAL